MPKILISYRRADASAIAGRIADRLSHHYGEDSVFMDVDSIPIGIDFRAHIQEMMLQTDVLIAVIGANWLGLNTAGGARIDAKTDAVRVEIEMAVARKMRIIPVLVDGAKMPESSALPPEFGDFVFLNAAEVATGRDFRVHMDRLIGAIDQSMVTGTRLGPAPAAALAVNSDQPTRNAWASDMLRYFAVPLVLLLAAHHLIVNLFDLRTQYLWAVCIVVPIAFGFAMFWVKQRVEGKAFALAAALGVVAVIGMTVSESLNSGDPFMPQTRFEWWDNFNFAAAIALSFIAGYTVARGLRAALGRKAAKL